MTSYTPLARCLALVLSLAILHPQGLLAQVNVTTQGGGGGTFTGGALTSPTTVLDGSNFSILNTADQTKQARFDLSANTTGQIRVYAMPNATTALAGLALSQTWTGATQTFPNGSNSVPAIAGNGAGMYFPAAGYVAFGTSSNGFLGANANLLSMGNGVIACWTPGGDAIFASCDTGLLRASAGVIRVTNGTANGIRGLLGGGAAVASATALPLPTGNVFHVTGTNVITSITATNFQAGVCITLIFDGITTLTDGSNLVMAGNFVTTADDTWSGCYDGTSFFETARSVN